ncbi:MAG: ABC transporter ATP-binding protein [Rhodospirillales bacterium]|nr:ABC transporter ATP-binding protein [Rhodospirillales bacterium]
MDTTLFKFIWRYSKTQQITLLLVTLVSFPFLYFSLDLPKIIINQAIGGSEFPKPVLGYDLEQIEYLLVLSFAFLALVLINGGFKFWINVFRGRLGERMLRRLRYILYGRVLRFPLPQFRKTSQGEIIAMVTAEVEPLGGYIGEALSLPAFQGGTLLTIIGFIMVQNPILGVAAIALYPIQMYIIPKLQRKINLLGKERVQAVRRLSEQIGESVSGAQEIHVHDTSAYARAHISLWLAKIYDIRYEIYRRKFFIKFLNNFIAQVTPFLFYSIGGVLVIKGHLSFGALVAVLAAYKDLSAPWKELLAHYQVAADARIKYDQLIEQFQPARMLPEEQQLGGPETFPALDGDIEISNVIVEDEDGFKSLDSANAIIPIKGSTAILGSSESGRDDLARLIARLTLHDKGTVKLAGSDISDVHEGLLGRRTAYVDQNAFVFSGTIRENIFYGLQHRPLAGLDGSSEEELLRDAAIKEAVLAGNSIDDPLADWIDFAGVGLTDKEQVEAHINDILNACGLRRDLREFGLQSSVQISRYPGLEDAILKARQELLSRLDDPKIARLVEPFDRDKFNSNMTVGENILMGTPVGPEFDLHNLGRNSYILSVLNKTNLYHQFLETGGKVAGMMIELFKDLPPGHEFFEQYSFIQSDDLPEFQQILRRAETQGLDGLSEEDKTQLLSLPFMLIPDRHRLGLADKDIRSKLVAARKIFADDLPDNLKDAIEFYDVDRYNAAASVQDNILFGKIAHGRAQARKEIGQVIDDVLEKLNLDQTLIDLGLDMPVGIAGGRLSSAQRQKICLARAMIKNPDLLILNDPLSALDRKTQEALMGDVIERFKGRGLIWVLNQPELASRFDRVLVMEEGRIVEQGTTEQLAKAGSRYHALAIA